MINVVIIDDEQNARSFLANLLTKELGSRLNLVSSCPSVMDGVKVIKNNPVDLVFLDIEMPEEDGFELIKYFDNIDFEIIFVTAHDRFAIRAFECSALHYLLKPLSPEKVVEAINRFKQTAVNREIHFKKHEEFYEYLESKQKKERILFNTTTGFDVVLLKQIIYVEALGNYCKIHLKDNKYKLVTRSMKSMEDCLPQSIFFRIHNSTIINLNEVSFFVNIDKEVKMSNNKELRVAERKLQLFKNRMSEMV
jgi:two-component system LytT family response regulator